jgi:glycosyltransferase involved in cell wall biosynthesis
VVKGWGAPSLVIQDIPAAFGPGRPFPVRGDFIITMVNSFSQDEPLEEMLEAAQSQPEVTFFVTGNPRARERRFHLNCPPNVIFTGFVDDQDYVGLLRASHAVMALTTQDHTMQRGACEALSLGKPIITSDWGLLKEFFYKGAVHVQNSAQAIREGVQEMRSQWQTLARETQELREEREREWVAKRDTLWALLEGIRQGP